MVTILAAAVSAIAAIAIAFISAYRKPPEVKIIDLQRVLTEASRSTEHIELVERAIAKQFKKLGTPDYSWWLLVWASVGAVLITMIAAVTQEHGGEYSPAVESILALVYLLGFALLLIRTFVSEGLQTHEWMKARRSRRLAASGTPVTSQVAGDSTGAASGTQST